MKSFQKLVFVSSFLPVLASATSIRQPLVQVAPNLVPIQIVKVGPIGRVVKEPVTQHPFTRFLIGIRGQVLADNACTPFVGQQLRKARALGIQAIGATNPETDACISVMPTPENVEFTFTMEVLTGGFVQAGRYHSETVRFEGLGLYNVTLDLEDNSVEVTPVSVQRM